jgi:hypothetical protein
VCKSRIQRLAIYIVVLFTDDQPIGETNTTNYSLKDLKSNTIYKIQIQYVTPQGDSVLSNPTILHTDDECKLRMKL